MSHIHKKYLTINIYTVDDTKIANPKQNTNPWKWRKSYVNKCNENHDLWSDFMMMKYAYKCNIFVYFWIFLEHNVTHHLYITLLLFRIPISWFWIFDQLNLILALTIQLLWTISVLLLFLLFVHLISFKIYTFMCEFNLFALIYTWQEKINVVQ